MSDDPQPRLSAERARTESGSPSAVWMGRLQAGDEAALSALMVEWELPVKALIARIVLNAREADELAQETFVRLWQQRQKFRPGAEFRPWLFAIAVNLARNRLRWWRHRPEVALEQWSGMDQASPGQAGVGLTLSDGTVRTGAEVLERAERADAVRGAIAALPLELREVVVLFEYEHLSHAEIAATLGITPKAVETRLYRAREKLRKSLAKWA